MPVPDTFDFTYALRRLRDGKRLARQGWNGRDMYVVLQPGNPEGIPINANTAAATGILPYLMFRTATGHFVPWVASQTDLLAYDWTEV